MGLPDVDASCAYLAANNPSQERLSRSKHETSGTLFPSPLRRFSFHPNLRFPSTAGICATLSNELHVDAKIANASASLAAVEGLSRFLPAKAPRVVSARRRSLASHFHHGLCARVVECTLHMKQEQGVTRGVYRSQSSVAIRILFHGSGKQVAIWASERFGRRKASQRTSGCVFSTGLMFCTASGLESQYAHS